MNLLFRTFSLCLLSAILFSCNNSKNDKLTTDTNPQPQSLQYLPTHSPITLDKAIQLQKKGKFSTDILNLNLGFTYSNAWIYLATQATKEKKIIYIENAHLDNVTFYTFHKQKLTSKFQSGDLQKFNKRSFTTNFINYQIPENTEYVFIEINTEGPLIAPISVKTIEELSNYLQKYNFIIGLYFGFILLILSSNIMIYIWLGEKLNLYYAGFLLCSAIITFVDLGYLFEFIWPNNPSLNGKIVPYFYLLGYYTLFFSEKLVNLKKYSQTLYKSFRIFYLIIPILIIIISVSSYNTALNIMIYITAFLPIVILLSGIYVYGKHKTVYFQFFIIGWFIYMISIGIFIITNTGYFQYDLFTSLIIQIGTGIQILFLNLAILSKIHTLTNEKEAILGEQNKLLEEKVTKRTQELNEKKNEIFDQNQQLQQQTRELQHKNKIIEDNNSLLQNQQEQLEKLVEKRTHELVEKNKSLKDSEEKFRFLAESVPVLIWTSDADGNLDFVNKRWTDYIGLQKSETDALQLFSTIHPDERESVIEKWEHSIKEGIKYEQKYKIKRISDGMYRWHIGSALPLKDNNGKIIRWVGTSVDIQEEKIIQDNLTQTNKELVKLNKDLDDFIYTTSHDLRVPLANIQGLSNGMADLLNKYQLEDSKEMSLILKMIDQSLKKQEKVIMDLTEIGKIQRMRELNTKEIFIDKIIDNGLKKLDTLIKKTNATIIRNDVSCPSFQFSPSNCQTIFDTLLKNAIMYHSQDRELVIEISCETSEKYIELSVKDNGLGIKDEYKNKVFGLFKRLYTHVEGSGLGLYMAKQIMDNSGGKIEFKSEYQKYTIFTVYFPKDL